VLGHRGGGQLRGVAIAIAHGPDRDLPQGGRVGVEAENDLAAPLFDERSELVSEGGNSSDTTAAGALPAGLTRFQRGRRRLALDCLLQGRAGAEARHPAGRDLDALTRLRIHTLTGPTVCDRELPEAGEVDFSASGQRRLDHLESGVYGLRGIALGQTRLGRNLVHEFGLRHCSSLTGV
jgi:hypothetical protein